MITIKSTKRERKDIADINELAQRMDSNAMPLSFGHFVDMVNNKRGEQDIENEMMCGVSKLVATRRVIDKAIFDYSEMLFNKWLDANPIVPLEEQEEELSEEVAESVVEEVSEELEAIECTLKENFITVIEDIHGNKYVFENDTEAEKINVDIVGGKSVTLMYKEVYNYLTSITIKSVEDYL